MSIMMTTRLPQIAGRSGPAVARFVRLRPIFKPTSQRFTVSYSTTPESAANQSPLEHAKIVTNEVFPVPNIMRADQPGSPLVASMAEYQRLWKESVEQPDVFYGRHARDILTWSTPFASVLAGSFHHNNTDIDPIWFPDGKLNAAYNCIDRHALVNPHKVALVHEPDNPSEPVTKVTYGQLLRQVSQLANALHDMGLRKGDTVCIYMPMVIETIVAMLACARLGLVHSVVFAGFSAESLRDRLNNGNCKVLLTADEGLRGGVRIPLKKIADEALLGSPQVRHVLVHKRTGKPSVPMTAGRDHWWDDVVSKFRTHSTPVQVAAEDPLFILYTSGSTGKPKGLVHSTAGFLLGTGIAAQYVFDVRCGSDDVFGNMGDLGWITAHSYTCYGPLLSGITSVLFESTPLYPTPERYWQTIERHGITQFYTSPTALRSLRRFGDEPVKRHDLSSVRVFGTAGEPIDPETWKWYHKVVAGGTRPVVDTYWQTETGACCITPLPGAIPTKPGSATVPFFGIDPVLIDPESGRTLTGNNVEGVLCFSKPWPSLARTIHGDHARYKSVYFSTYPGMYMTGDAAYRDEDGYIWMLGRTDDIINVAGHRMSTSEVEGALVAHDVCAEAAVVGAHDDVKGQVIVAFVTLKDTHIPRADIPAILTEQVRHAIGPVVTPKRVVIVPDLPKTRSGKIMRRFLRKIADGEHDKLGDATTLADPTIVKAIVDIWKEMKKP